MTHAIEKYLRTNNLSVQVVHRDSMKKSFSKGKDLIIVTGGDGTFLKTSHFVMDNTPLMGINPKPKESYGFFSRQNHIDFRKKLRDVLSKKTSPKKLFRLKVVIGGKEVPYRVLNEVFYANNNPSQITYYRLNGELQMSSGIIVSTAAGSTAWSQSAGGKVLPLFSSNFQYLVREPYKNKFPTSKHYNKILKKNERVVIEDLMGDSFIGIDGTQVSYPLKRGEKLVITMAQQSLNVIL